MIICEYGCGQEAKYQFGNGKWCCSKNTSLCPKLRQINSDKNKGKVPWNKDKTNIFSKESLKKISDSGKNRIISKETRQKLSNLTSGKNNPMFGKQPWNKGKTGLQKAWNKGKTGSQKAWNKGKTGIYSQESLKKMSESRMGKEPWNKNISFKTSINQIKKKYPTFALIEEMRYNPDKPGEKEIQVHCKNHNCLNSKEQGGWFTPTKNTEQLSRRIWSIENEEGNGYLYCSEECKHECPLYRKSVSQIMRQDLIAAGYIEEDWYTSAEYQIFRNTVFDLDDGLCVWCGKPATIVHHINPQKVHPEQALDSENGLSSCEECHYKYGHRDRWCTTGNLAKLICVRKVRAQKKINKNNGEITSNETS